MQPLAVHDRYVLVRNGVGEGGGRGGGREVHLPLGPSLTTVPLRLLKLDKGLDEIPWRPKRLETESLLWHWLS